MGSTLHEQNVEAQKQRDDICVDTIKRQLARGDAGKLQDALIDHRSSLKRWTYTRRNTASDEAMKFLYDLWYAMSSSHLLKAELRDSWITRSTRTRRRLVRMMKTVAVTNDAVDTFTQVRREELRRGNCRHKVLVLLIGSKEPIQLPQHEA